MKIIIAPARNMKADPDSLPIQGLPQFFAANGNDFRLSAQFKL